MKNWIKVQSKKIVFMVKKMVKWINIRINRIRKAWVVLSGKDE